MKIARYLAHGAEHYGVVDGDTVTAIEGSIFDAPITLTDHTHALSEVQLLAPVAPGKILAMGLNYTSHIGDRPAPEYPMIFHKTPTSVIGPEAAIIRPKEVQRFDARRDGSGHQGPVPLCVQRGCAEPCAGLHLRQRCERPRLAAERPAGEQFRLVAGQVRRHFFANGAVD